MTTSEDNRNRLTAHHLAVGAVIVLGVAVRMFGLGRRDFWFDESCTFQYVQALVAGPNWSDMLRESTNLPYYVVLRAWVGLFGESEAAYRSLSAVAASVALAPLGWTARKLAGRRAALICLALGALHPLHVFYAHEARVYALWSLEMSLVLAALVAAVRKDGLRWWVAYGAALAVAMHTHYITVFAVVPSIAALLMSTNRSRSFTRWAWTTVAGMGATAPYAYFAVLPATGTGGRDWIAGDWDPFLAIPRTLWAMLPAGGYPMHLRGLSLASPDTIELLPAPVSVAAMILPVIVMAGCALRLVSRPKGALQDSAIKGRHLALGAMAIGPLVMLWLFSLLRTPIYLPGRYDLVVWPVLLVWMAVIVSGFADGWGQRGPRVGGAITVALWLCALVPINRSLRLHGESPHHRRADRIAEVTGPGDLVITFSYDRDYLLYYLHRAGFAGETVSFPSWLDRQVGWLDTPADLDPARAGALAGDAESLLRRIAETRSSNGRVLILEDSLNRPGQPGPRTSVNEHLLTRLRNAGYHARPVEVDRAPAIYDLAPGR
jgi:hypothetical protein